MTPGNKKTISDQILAYVLTAGLFVQLSGRLWLPDNYATITYLLFFVPSIIAFVKWRIDFWSLLSRSDKPLLFSLIALFIWLILSTLWSQPNNDQWENFVFSTKVILLILIYVLSVALLYQKGIAFISTAALSTVAVLTIAAAITLIYFHHLNYPIRSNNRIASIGYGAWSLQLNPVVTAIYYGSFTIMAFILSTNKQLSIITRLLVLLGSIICLTLLFFTWTRTAAAGLAGATIAYFWWLSGWRRTGLLLTSGTLLIAVCVVTMPVWFEQYINRSGFGSWRPEIWLVTWEICLKNFLFGVGLNTDSHMTVSRTFENEIQTLIFPHAHNFYLQVLYWVGAVGLLLYLTVLLRAIQLAWREKHNFYFRLCFVSLVYFYTVQMFDVYSIFIRPSYYWACIWFPVGILLGCSAKQKCGNPEIIHQKSNIICLSQS